jgi:DNA ligase 1
MFKPMLAVDADIEKLKFPLLASAKLDGVRAVVHNNMVYSRSNKPIPNRFVQEQFNMLDAVDGELIVGHANSSTVYRDTVSHVMSHDKTGYDLTFHVFDHIRFPEKRYTDRHNLLHFDGIRHANVIVHEQRTIMNPIALLAFEEEMLDAGYEGLILRDPHAPYKHGRSTVKEGYLLKMKRFVDSEAVVIGFEERMHNGNEATTNELGRTKRSSHAAGKTGRGDLGALVVRFGDIEFNIGTGFDDVERRAIWDDRDNYLGRLAKFKYFPVGVKEAPRHPVFLGWRDKEDM